MLAAPKAEGTSSKDRMVSIKWWLGSWGLLCTMHDRRTSAAKVIGLIGSVQALIGLFAGCWGPLWPMAYGVGGVSFRRSSYQHHEIGVAVSCITHEKRSNTANYTSFPYER